MDTRAETHGEEERRCNLESCVSGLTGSFSRCKMIHLVIFTQIHASISPTFTSGLSLENVLSPVADVAFFFIPCILGPNKIKHTVPLCQYMDIVCVCVYTRGCITEDSRCVGLGLPPEFPFFTLQRAFTISPAPSKDDLRMAVRLYTVMLCNNGQRTAVSG